MATHRLKILPEHFVPVLIGIKTAELRLNDRSYKQGDELELYEWDGKAYTGRSVARVVTQVLEYPPALKEGWVMLCMKPNFSV